jgi:uncharacterized membrane protein YqjE
VNDGAENTEAGGEPAASAGARENGYGPAREMSLHLLRMLETRIEAAGIALQAEAARLMSRLQLQLLAAAAFFIAIWGGIVLLAIALPPNLRVPVLSAVVAAFVVGAIWALLRARRMVPGREVGSLSWFLDALKLDLEVLSRSLANHPQATQDEEPRRARDDLAA